jgi:hypothetical protein
VRWSALCKLGPLLPWCIPLLLPLCSVSWVHVSSAFWDVASTETVHCLDNIASTLHLVDRQRRLCVDTDYLRTLVTIITIKTALPYKATPMQFIIGCSKCISLVYDSSVQECQMWNVRRKPAVPRTNLTCLGYNSPQLWS